MPLKCDFLAIGKERPSKVIHKMYKIHACCKQTKLLELKYKDRQWFTHGMWITHCFERRKGNVPWDMEYSRYRRKRIMNSILSPRGGLIGRFLFYQNCRDFEEVERCGQNKEVTYASSPSLQACWVKERFDWFASKLCSNFILFLFSLSLDCLDCFLSPLLSAHVSPKSSNM